MLPDNYLLRSVSYLYRLVGDVLVCTAFLSYSGPFNQDYRALLNSNWFKELRNRKIPYTMNLSIIDTLTDPTMVRFRGLWNYKVIKTNSYNIWVCGNVTHKAISIILLHMFTESTMMRFIMHK